jgi:hypothetical protein
MLDPRPKLLDRLSRRTALEAFVIESGPAIFEPLKSERSAGYAEVLVSRASIAIRFGTDTPLAVTEAGYGESNGVIAATNGAWRAPRVNDAGLSAAGDRLFVTPELVIGQGGEIAATRLIFAGAGWRGLTQLDGRHVVAESLTKEAVNHHDARLSITVEGALEPAIIEAIDRAGSFVSGIDLELLRVESFTEIGDAVQTRHLRGFRRVGRYPHSPFTGINDEDRMRAWTALVSAIPRLSKAGIPIVQIINLIGAHNQAPDINTSAPLLLLATQAAAYHYMHGGEIKVPSPVNRLELVNLNQKLGLNLTTANLDRFENLRVELLDAGFFHKPGYETGRPQKDIKFLRDLAHMIIFRMCGYAGPFYGSETFAIRGLSNEKS